MDSSLERVAKAANALNEHFESVLIIVTENIDGSTNRCSSDRGNCYASISAAEEWIEEKREEVKVRVRRKNQDEGP